MDWTLFIPYAIPLTVWSLIFVAQVAGTLSTQAEEKQASRVARIEGTVSRMAGGIASNLLQAKSAGTTGDVLTALRGAAVSQAADYVLSSLPDTVKAAGATKDSLIQMLHGEISKQVPDLHVPPATLTALGGALLPSDQSPAAFDAAPGLSADAIRATMDDVFGGASPAPAAAPASPAASAAPVPAAAG